MKRGLKLRHLHLIALGGIIGSGYFLGTGYVLGKAGPASVLAYLLGGLIVLSVMLCLGELAVHQPVSSSFITYTKQHISPSWACGVGWSYWITWVTYVPSEMIAGGIIMNKFFPVIGPAWWAVLFGVLITVINLFHVEKFGETEFWLAIIKIVALVMFCFIAVLILCGVIGDSSVMHAGNIFTAAGFAPHGYEIIFLTMVIILVNFQGSEIIGLAAGECKNPEKSIPLAVRNVIWRIIGLYIIPILLLVSIFPWEQASLEDSVFAAALHNYGLGWAGDIFAIVVLTAAVSCSNSGLYGCSRALYALAKEDMAPFWLSKLDNKGIPRNATIVSIIGCWIGVILYTADTSAKLYTTLLALSGFTGAIAWISICWSQYNFRKQLQYLGQEGQLRYRVPLFPYFTLFGLWAQVLCLGVVAFTEDLRISLYIGIPILILPIVWYRLRFYNKKTAPLQNDEGVETL